MRRHAVEVLDRRFVVRSDTLDRVILRETEEGQYGTRCAFSSADRWLDAGAHIGAFSVIYAARVAAIAAYEPEPDNYALLCRNLALNGCGNVCAQRAALVGNADTERPFYVHKRGNTSAHSLLALGKHRKTTVPAENINEALARHRIDCIKMDVEGAEAELIATIADWAPIRQAVIEWHYRELERDPEPELDLLAQHFAVVRVEPEQRNGAGWIVCRKRKG